MSYVHERAAEFARRITRLGFTVYLAERGTYGFITDDKRERVLSFSFNDGESLNGNYEPPSKESGTGWRLAQAPEQLQTVADVHAALYSAPDYNCGKGWKRYTTVKEHLDSYGSSSRYWVLTVGYRRGREDYAAIRDEANDPTVKAVEVSQDELDEMLNVLPPIYVPGGFLVGEQITGDERGDVYAHYAERNGKAYAKYAVRGRPETYIGAV